MTTGQKFDRILDQVIRFADKDSIDGRFSYTKPNRPRNGVQTRAAAVRTLVALTVQPFEP